jgi:hypothetical protein
MLAGLVVELQFDRELDLRLELDLTDVATP